MSSTKLILIVQNIDKKGKASFKRLDTEEVISSERIHMVKQRPLTIHLEPPFDLPIYIYKIRGFREKANAILVGDMLGDKENVYCSASYCKI